MGKFIIFHSVGGIRVRLGSDNIFSPGPMLIIHMHVTEPINMLSGPLLLVSLSWAPDQLISAMSLFL